MFSIRYLSCENVPLDRWSVPIPVDASRLYCGQTCTAATATLPWAEIEDLQRAGGPSAAFSSAPCILGRGKGWVLRTSLAWQAEGTALAKVTGQGHRPGRPERAVGGKNT